METPKSREIPSISTNLLSQVQSMDDMGWERFVSIFAPVVYTWCRQSGVSESDAPDLVQDVFATVARKVSDFHRQEEGDSFRSWLATITRCRVIDHYRKSRKQPLGIGGSDAMQMLQQAPDEWDSTISWSSSESLLVKQVLRQVESEFEAVTWQAFWSTTIETRSASDVAETLGISIASVYQAKSRVLRRLRQRLSELP